MKGFKALCILTLGLIMAFSPAYKVQAADDTSNAESAKNGVVQVNTVFTDESNVKHIICGASGFLIGDSEGSEYVITCNHILDPDDETITAALEYLELPNSEEDVSKISFSTEVVVEGDVVLSTTVVNTSAELDLAVLQLPQPIYTKSPLTLLTSQNYEVANLPYAIADTVYAMGYPDAITYDSETQYYSDEQVAMTMGHIVNLVNLQNVQVIESDAAVGANNCGGPLVDEYGYVIGMNLLTSDGMYSCALDSTKITKLLDGLGIQYSCEYERPVEEEEAPETEVSDTQDKGIPTYIIVIICVGIVAVVAGITTTVIVIVINKDKPKKKSKKQLKQEEEARMQSFINKPGVKTPKDPFKFEAANDNYGPTDTVILAGKPASSETTILGQGQGISQQIKMGTLIRVKTGEKIPLNKGYFTIGKDSLHADYYVKDNGTISRQHAAIRQTNNGIFLEDCNSTNGTWLNGVKLEKGGKQKLSNGSVIKISNEEFKYEL